MNHDRAGIQLPTDVLLYIIEFVDHPKDLLAFALTNRTLCAAIIPGHINYRRISCTISSDHVWKHLLDTPNICSRIRYLTTEFGEQTGILRLCRSDPNSTTLPTRADPDYTLFSQALSKMVNLKEIKHTTGSDYKSIWVIFEVLGKAGCELEEMKVCAQERIPSQHLEGDSEFSKNRETFSLFYNRLPSLRKYTIRNDPSYDVLQMLIAPNLTHMNVTHSYQAAFLSGYWPNLQHLASHKVTRDNTESEIHSLREFFYRHPRLITLLTDGILRSGWATESDDFLPNLRSFGITIYYTSDYGNTTITSHIAAHLTYLHMNAPSYSYLKKYGTILSNLETCMYMDADPGTSVQDLVDLIPNIKNLCVRFGPFRTGSYPRRNMTADEVVERIPFFANFKYLRVLLGPFDDTRISVHDHPLCKLLYDLPNILYTRARLRVNGRSEVLRLKRDSTAEVMRYECEKTCPHECNENSWGDFFEE